MKESPKIKALVKKKARDLIDKCANIVTNLMQEYKSSLRESICNEKSIVFPEGTRFFTNGLNRTTVVIEDKPRIRTVKFKNSLREDKSRAIILTFNSDGNFLDMCIAYRNAPLQSTEDVCYYCNLPNVSCYSVCLGWDPAITNISQMTKDVISRFWNSSFNNDLTDNWFDMSDDQRFKSPESWEKASLKNPLFVLKVKWFGKIKLANLLPVSNGSRIIGRVMAEVLSRSIDKLPSLDVEKVLEDTITDSQQKFKKQLYNRAKPK